MKIFFSTLTILLVVVISSLAQDSPASSYFTDDKLNGRYWDMLSNSDKSTYVTGLSDGILLCGEIEAAHIKAKVEQREHFDTFKLLSPYIPEKLSTEEIVKYMDDFYSKESNIDTPVASAYFYVLTVYEIEAKDKSKK